MGDDLRAGAASEPFEPPFGLTLFGAARQTQTGTGSGLPLETSAVVLESGGTRVAMCGAPISVASTLPRWTCSSNGWLANSRWHPSGVLLNWSHTNQGILSSCRRSCDEAGGAMGPSGLQPDERTVAFPLPPLAPPSLTDATGEPCTTGIERHQRPALIRSGISLNVHILIRRPA
jgi:hypothetical protein